MSRNIIERFLATTDTLGQQRAVQRYKNRRWETLSWNQYKDYVTQLSCAIEDLGFKHGDRAVIWSTTRFEWAVTDLAIMASGGVVIPVYDTTTSDEMSFILSETKPKLIFCETLAKVESLQPVLERLGMDPQLICLEHVPDSQNNHRHTWEEIVLAASEPAAKNPNRLSLLQKRITMKDLASVIYTSGTSGQPKGAMILHSQVASEVEDLVTAIDVDSLDVSLTLLPYAHVLGRIEHWTHVTVGFTMIYAQSIERFRDNLIKFKPTFFIAVPRVFEKIHASAVSSVERTKLKKSLLNWAMNVGKKVNHARSSQLDLPMKTQFQYQLARRLILEKLAQQLGGRLRFAMSGGAPLSSDIAEFFQSAGILVLEGYGLTETTGAISVNTARAFRFGTVGRPLPDVQFRIEEDGEILVKSKKVMPGYYENKEATNESFTSDGWFRTGDIGEITDGFLRITDRKKDLLKTAGGKYIAPQKIELQLGLSPYISHSVVIADRRKYAVALIFPNIDELLKLPDFQEFKAYSPAVLVTDIKIRNFYRALVAETNSHLASFESIKNFDLVSANLSIEGGELTPSLKIKRHAIAKRFAPEIDALYGPS